jgi:hypothetical protein
MGYASNIKDRDGACRDHLVIRIPTEDIHLLLFQNTDGNDFGWIKATVDLNAFFRLDNGDLHRCFVNGKVGGLLGRIIDKFCLPFARIPVLDHEDDRGTYQGTGDTERVQESSRMHESSLSPQGVSTLDASYTP